MRTVSVDVGLNALGWAVWDGPELAPPRAAGVLTARRARACGRHSWAADKARGLLLQFEEQVLSYWGPRVVVMEWAEFRAGDAVGHSAAARGDLGKLNFMAGAHAWMAWNVGARVVLVAPGEWKGQLPKDVVSRRIAAAIGPADSHGVQIVTHAWDAVGIGLHHHGHRLDGPAFSTSRRGPRRVVRRKGGAK